ncbi:MAG: OadG family protein [Ignavibacteriales bacterium]|nr:OadG family protein [Ignavibacteriales bacterium]
MFLQNISSDTTKVIQDTLSTAAAQDDVFSHLGFNLSNLGSSDVVLTVLGYSIVFLSLLLLYIVFFNLAKLLNLNLKKKLQKAGKQTPADDDLGISGETIAAISMAILLDFQEAHDFENTVITIKKVQSSYSPWNSKLYGLRQNPKY